VFIFIGYLDKNGVSEQLFCMIKQLECQTPSIRLVAETTYGFIG